MGEKMMTMQQLRLPEIFAMMVYMISRFVLALDLLFCMTFPRLRNTTVSVLAMGMDIAKDTIKLAEQRHAQGQEQGQRPQQQQQQQQMNNNLNVAARETVTATKDVAKATLQATLKTVNEMVTLANNGHHNMIEDLKNTLPAVAERTTQVAALTEDRLGQAGRTLQTTGAAQQVSSATEWLQRSFWSTTNHVADRTRQARETISSRVSSAVRTAVPEALRKVGSNEALQLKLSEWAPLDPEVFKRLDTLMLPVVGPMHSPKLHFARQPHLDHVPATNQWCTAGMMQEKQPLHSVNLRELQLEDGRYLYDFAVRNGNMLEFIPDPFAEQIATFGTRHYGVFYIRNGKRAWPNDLEWHDDVKMQLPELKNMVILEKQIHRADPNVNEQTNMSTVDPDECLHAHINSILLRNVIQPKFMFALPPTFQQLVKSCHERSMRVIVEINMDATSDNPLAQLAPNLYMTGLGSDALQWRLDRPTGELFYARDFYLTLVWHLIEHLHVDALFFTASKRPLPESFVQELSNYARSLSSRVLLFGDQSAIHTEGVVDALLEPASDNTVGKQLVSFLRGGNPSMTPERLKELVGASPRRLLRCEGNEFAELVMPLFCLGVPLIPQEGFSSFKNFVLPRGLMQLRKKLLNEVCGEPIDHFYIHPNFANERVFAISRGKGSFMMVANCCNREYPRFELEYSCPDHHEMAIINHGERHGHVELEHTHGDPSLRSALLSVQLHPYQLRVLEFVPK